MSPTKNGCIKMLLNVGNRFFLNGVQRFIEFSKQNPPQGSTHFHFPCRSCANRYQYDEMTMMDHIINDGFVRNYTRWNLHGERCKPARLESSTVKEKGGDMIGMVRNAFGLHSPVHDDTFSSEPDSGKPKNTRKLDKLLYLAATPLYPGCKKYSTLIFLVRMLEINTKGKVTNTTFSEYLEFL